MNGKKEIVLYDGECKFCTITKNTVQNRDVKDRFRYVSTHSDEGKELTKKYQLDTDASAYVISGDTVRGKSEMARYILKRMGWPEWVVGKLSWFVPKFIADTMYDFVASHRLFLNKKR